MATSTTGIFDPCRACAISRAGTIGVKHRSRRVAGPPIRSYHLPDWCVRTRQGRSTLTHTIESSGRPDRPFCSRRTGLAANRTSEIPSPTQGCGSPGFRHRHAPSQQKGPTGACPILLTAEAPVAPLFHRLDRTTPSCSRVRGWGGSGAVRSARCPTIPAPLRKSGPGWLIQGQNPPGPCMQGCVAVGRHSIFRAEMKASCGMSTLPNWRIFFLPAFCFSRSFFLRVASPP
jgi:hypothetical protein